MRKNIIRPITRSIFGSMVVLLAIAMIVLQACSTSDDPTIGTPTVDKFGGYTDQGTPNAGPVGTLVKLTGTYYSAAGTNTVKFNGVEAKVITSLTTVSNLAVVVPAGASTGKITVTVGGHTGTSTADFTVNTATPAPGIIKFTTSGNGVDGTEVSITGVNFSNTPANNVVTFKSGLDPDVPVVATVTSVNVTDPLANVIKVNVPAGARTGKLTVKVAGATGTAISESDFTVPTPNIKEFTPSNSIVGGTATITGTNFSKTPANNVVKFNGSSAGVVQKVTEKIIDGVTYLVLEVTIPGDASTGKITVALDGVAGSSPGDDFKIN